MRTPATNRFKDQERGKRMSDAVGVKKSTAMWESHPVKPLDEAVWEAWKAKGRAQDRRGRETRIKALKRGFDRGVARRSRVMVSAYVL